MTSVNQRSNWLQSIIGIYFHACDTPDSVIEVLAHSGISISISSINNAVNSLSKKASQCIKDLGQTFLVAYCIDNIGWDQKPANSTLENQGFHVETTNGFLIKLQHGVSLENLHISKILWESSPYNPSPTSPPFQVTYGHLLQLIWDFCKSSLHLSPTESPASKLSFCLQLWTWHICQILVTYDKNFLIFKSSLGGPLARIRSILQNLNIFL